MARSRTQVVNFRDFTGGLNLVADTFRLEDNESPDLLNVDVDRRGGFQVRRGVKPYINGAGNVITATNLWLGQVASVQYTFAQEGGAVKYTTGSSWSTLTTSTAQTTGNGSQDVCPIVFNNVAYWVRGNFSPIKWDGASSTSAVYLTSNFNDTTTATSGNMPRANHAAVHAGYAWVADTYESGTRYPNRVRWSWANTFNDSGENWRSEDYIDIDDGKDSDAITAIIPFGDQLIVFKRDSMYAIYGYSSESFAVVNISNTIGAVSHSAALVTPSGLFFFDHQTGIHVYSGSSTRWVFNQIWPAMRDGSIPSGSVDNVQLGWIKQRLWVSVPWVDEAAPRAYTFVFDPQAKQGGSWTKYDLECGPYRRGHRAEDDVCYIYGTNLLFRLDYEDQYYDDFGYSIGTKTINAYYRTRWIDFGQPAVKKRWRRVEAVLQALEPYNLPIEVYRDYNAKNLAKAFTLSTEYQSSSASEGIWDDPASEWDEVVWAEPSGIRGEVDRGSGLGVSRSVSLKIGGSVMTQQTATSPSTSAFWGVDALMMKFVPRRLR